MDPFHAGCIAKAFGKAVRRCIVQQYGIVSDLDLLPEEDQLQISSWNSSPSTPINTCLHEAFHQAVSQYSDSVAINSWDGSMTYSELDRVSSRIAHYLIESFNIKSGIYVPICFEKSIWAVVAMLAVLKSGAAYCCLDPAHPTQRHNHIINSLRAPFVLTSKLQSKLFIQHKTVVVDPSLNTTLKTPDTLPKTDVTPTDTCIVVWTSGSTGNPKGIVHSHLSMCTGLFANAYHQGLSTKSLRVFQWTSYTFDVSISEIHVPLLHGGCLCIPSDDDRLNNVQASMNAMKIDWAYFTPSFARFVQRYSIPTLKTLVMGGEAVTVDDINAWADRYRVIDAYGPAENVAWFCGDQVVQTSKTISFGHLTTGYAWIVDSDNHETLLPIGAVGELLVEGPTVFLQYMNDPERTQRTLVDAPSWRKSVGVPSSYKVYKTGDLVKYLPDGSMTYIGRKDTMVKIRGQRIELEEIEVHLRRSLPEEADSGVDVIVRNGKIHDIALVAFICMKGNSQDSDWLSEVKAHAQAEMRKTLPEYMIPHIFLPMESLIYNASHKLDRKALRSYALSLPADKLLQTQVRAKSVSNSEEGSTAKEKILRDLWSRGLNIDVESIRHNDNFFSLGGSSITAIQLVASARERGLQLKLIDVLKASSLRDLASAASISSAEVTVSYLPFSLLDVTQNETIIRDAMNQCQVLEEKIEDILPPTPQQEGLWASSLVQQGDYVCQFLLNLKPEVDVDRLCEAWESVVQNVPTLRTRFIQSGRRSFQVVVREPVKWIRRSSLQDYLQEDNQNLVDFGKQLSRFALISEETNTAGISKSELKNTLVWTSHHALYDGQTVPMILNAVTQLYTNGSSDLITTIPFGLFVQSIRNIDTNASENYWRAQFEEIDPISFPVLPTTTYKPKATSLYSRIIPIKQRQRSHIVPATVIRAALALTIAFSAGINSVVIGETTSGRNSQIPYIEKFTGPTFVTLPRLVAVDPNTTISEYLRQIQDSTIDLIPFQHVGVQGIRKMSTQCAKACQFQTLLLIETPDDTGYEDLFVFDENSIYTGGTQKFESHSLIWKCYPLSTTVELRAIFDGDVIDERQVERMSNIFERCLSVLSEPEESHTLGSLRDAVVPQVEPQCLKQKSLDSSKDTFLLEADNDSVSTKLHQVWCDILQLNPESVAPNDNFFARGGDSLSAMAFVADARAVGVSITVAQVVQNPIISDLIALASDSTAKQNRIGMTLAPITTDDQLKEVQKAAFLQAGMDLNDIENIMPANPWQDSIMSLSQGWTGAMMAQYIVAIPKEYSIDTFKRAWDMLVEHYSILRTRVVFTNRHGAFQVVTKQKITWDSISDLQQYLEQDRINTMEFGDPLVRFAILDNTGTNQSSTLVWTIHHALYDYFILQKLLANAIALLKGIPLPPIVPYDNFIRYMTSFDKEAKRSFWTKELDNWAPHNFPPLPSSSYTADADAYFTKSITFPNRGNSDFTTPTIVRAAWTLMISQLTGFIDIVNHQALSGRSAPVKSVGDIIGPMLNLVPVRTNVDPEKNIMSWLKEIRDNAAKLIPLEHTGLKEIKRYNQACRDACAFQNLLVIQFAGLEKVSENINTLDDEPISDSSDKLEVIDLLTNFKYFNVYGILFFCTLTTSGAEISVSYDSKTIDADQMQRCVRHFDYLMKVLRSPVHELEGLRISDISKINPDDLADLASWNKNGPESRDVLLQDLIAPGFLVDAGKVAIHSHDGQLSYSELDELSTRLAAHLRSRGIKSESVVPLLFEKSIWAIVSILAVLKAGGAFMFLDPQHSISRHQELIEKVKAHIVLTSKNLHAHSILLKSLEVLSIDQEMMAILKIEGELEKSWKEEIDIQPSNAAYISSNFATSGTSKLIVHSHMSLSSAISSHGRVLGVTSNTHALQLSDYTSDLMIHETFLLLMKGGCIHLQKDEEKADNLANFIYSHKIDWCILTTQAARSLRHEELPSLKTLILYGEQLDLDDEEYWSNKLHVIRCYGSGESTGLVIGDLNDSSRLRGEAGYGIGVSPWVVDSNTNKLLPIGALGEIAFSGPTLGKEFSGNTPVILLGPEGETKIYKTGNIGRINSNGSLSILGRIDTQTMIGRQTINLWEIESSIRSVLPKSVDVAVDVVTRQTGEETQTLTAFISQDLNGAKWESRWDEFREIVSKLKSHLRKYPEFMIPHIFVPLGPLPIDSNGKLDRAALRSLGTSISAAELTKFNSDNSELAFTANLKSDEEVAMQINEELVKLVSEVDESQAETLRSENTELSDSGIDSMQITSLAMFVQKSYKVRIPLRNYLRSGTRVRDIAQIVMETMAEQETDVNSNIQPWSDFQKLDQELSGGILPSAIDPQSRQATGIVFLSGATGFLGIQVLRQLLAQPQVKKVITLVRATDAKHARQRILSSARVARWWASGLLKRTEVWTGDLEKQKFGLQPEQWERLQGLSKPRDQNIDAIVHIGANVDRSSGYRELRNVNVLSTSRLLSVLRSSSSLHSFTYVSGGDIASEDSLALEEPAELNYVDGYSQGKFVSELLVKSFAKKFAVSNHLQIAIVKPGIIIGTASEGVSKTDDFIWRVVAGAVKSGGYNRTEQEAWLSICGADEVARLVVGSIFPPQTQTSGRLIFKLVDGITIKEFWGTIGKVLGTPLKGMGLFEWINALGAKIEKEGDAHPTFPVMHLLEKADGKIGKILPSAQPTQRQIPKGGIIAAITKSVEYLASTGFLNMEETESIDK